MKSNLYIFEGPDNCGKTTLAKAFAQDTGALYSHFSTPDPDKPFNYQYDSLSTQVNHTVDRSWVSNIFYDAVRHNTPRDSTYMFTQYGRMAAMQNRFNCYYIWVHRNWYEAEPAHLEELDKRATNLVAGENKIIPLHQRALEHANFKLSGWPFREYQTLLKPRSAAFFNTPDAHETADIAYEVLKLCYLIDLD